MRVLFASWAGGGHFAPLVPLGWALRAAGHQVLVACHPSQTQPIVSAGLGALPVGPDVDMFELLRAKREERRWRPGGRDGGNARGYLGMVETSEAIAEVLVDELLDFCQHWGPDLV